MAVSKNAYLTEDEMKVNAGEIYSYLTSRGWSVHAVAGMLGNMEVESTINPGIWQNLDAGNTSLGFGLVQWTPALKLFEWAGEEGRDPSSLKTQLARIIYEVENGLQWIQTDSYPLTFKEFTTSTLSPYYLAGAFVSNYERPSDPDVKARGELGDKWYTYLTGSDFGGGGILNPDDPYTPPVKRNELPLWMKYVVTRR